MKEKKSTKKVSLWSILASCSFLCSSFTLYKGIDKLTNYYNSESYSYLNKNAYVGGDAYNYIINGTHATAFFVLTTMFVLAAIGLMILHYVSQNQNQVPQHADLENNVEELPEL